MNLTRQLAAAVSLFLCASAMAHAAVLPAFPGAEGFGATTPGGRGGEVLFVTNLEDYASAKKSIAGSLRAACSASGPRIVVFRVSGTIALAAPLKISEPYLTIAGQSAPGGGICVKNFGVTVATHDVVLRHLRIRPGDELGEEYRQRGKSFEPDGLAIGVGSHHVVVDHCPVSWAIDECLSVTGDGVSDVTAQWCMVTEALTKSFHHKGAHGYGSLLRTNGNLSFHHNLYAHNLSRSPRPGTYGEGSELLDFRNNVIYDTHGYSAEDPVRLNYVANYVKRPHKRGVFQVGGPETRMFVDGNYLVDGGQRNADPWSLILDATEANKAAKPFEFSPITPMTAEAAYEAVCESCGATLPRRDAVDTRIIQQLQSASGGLINSPKDVGGWPLLASEAAPSDEDQDGMPDGWEAQYGLQSSTAGGDLDGDGYTNIEEYLNGTDPTKFVDYMKPENNVNTLK